MEVEGDSDKRRSVSTVLGRVVSVRVGLQSKEKGYRQDAAALRAWTEAKASWLKSCPTEALLNKVQPNVHGRAAAPAAVATEDDGVAHERGAGAVYSRQLLAHLHEDRPEHANRLARLQQLFSDIQLQRHLHGMAPFAPKGEEGPLSPAPLEELWQGLLDAERAALARATQYRQQQHQHQQVQASFERRASVLQRQLDRAEKRLAALTSLIENSNQSQQQQKQHQLDARAIESAAAPAVSAGALEAAVHQALQLYNTLGEVERRLDKLTLQARHQDTLQAQQRAKQLQDRWQGLRTACASRLCELRARAVVDDVLSRLVALEADVIRAGSQASATADAEITHITGSPHTDAVVEARVEAVCTTLDACEQEATQLHDSVDSLLRDALNKPLPIISALSSPETQGRTDPAAAAAAAAAAVQVQPALLSAPAKAKATAVLSAARATRRKLRGNVDKAKGHVSRLSLCEQATTLSQWVASLHSTLCLSMGWASGERDAASNSTATNTDAAISALQYATASGKTAPKSHAAEAEQDKEMEAPSRDDGKDESQGSADMVLQAKLLRSLPPIFDAAHVGRVVARHQAALMGVSREAALLSSQARSLAPAAAAATTTTAAAAAAAGSATAAPRASTAAATRSESTPSPLSSAAQTPTSAAATASVSVQGAVFDIEKRVARYKAAVGRARAWLIAARRVGALADKTARVVSTARLVQQNVNAACKHCHSATVSQAQAQAVTRAAARAAVTGTPPATPPPSAAVHGEKPSGEEGMDSEGAADAGLSRTSARALTLLSNGVRDVQGEAKALLLDAMAKMAQSSKSSTTVTSGRATETSSPRTSRKVSQQQQGEQGEQQQQQQGEQTSHPVQQLLDVSGAVGTANARDSGLASAQGHQGAGAGAGVDTQREQAVLLAAQQMLEHVLSTCIAADSAIAAAHASLDKHARLHVQASQVKDAREVALQAVNGTSNTLVARGRAGALPSAAAGLQLARVITNSGAAAAGDSAGGVDDAVQELRAVVAASEALNSHRTTLACVLDTLDAIGQPTSDHAAAGAEHKQGAGEAGRADLGHAGATSTPTANVIAGASAAVLSLERSRDRATTCAEAAAAARAKLQQLQAVLAQEESKQAAAVAGAGEHGAAPGSVSDAAGAASPVAAGRARLNADVNTALARAAAAQQQWVERRLAAEECLQALRAGLAFAQAEQVVKAATTQAERVLSVFQQEPPLSLLQEEDASGGATLDGVTAALRSATARAEETLQGSDQHGSGALAVPAAALAARVGVSLVNARAMAALAAQATSTGDTQRLRGAVERARKQERLLLEVCPLLSRQRVLVSQLQSMQQHVAALLAGTPAPSMAVSAEQVHQARVCTVRSRAACERVEAAATRLEAECGSTRDGVARAGLSTRVPVAATLAGSEAGVDAGTAAGTEATAAAALTAAGAGHRKGATKALELPQLCEAVVARARAGKERLEALEQHYEHRLKLLDVHRDVSAVLSAVQRQSTHVPPAMMQTLDDLDVRLRGLQPDAASTTPPTSAEEGDEGTGSGVSSHALLGATHAAVLHDLQRARRQVEARVAMLEAVAKQEAAKEREATQAVAVSGLAGEVERIRRQVHAVAVHDRLSASVIKGKQRVLQSLRAQLGAASAQLSSVSEHAGSGASVEAVTAAMDEKAQVLANLEAYQQYRTEATAFLAWLDKTEKRLQSTKGRAATAAAVVQEQARVASLVQGVCDRTTEYEQLLATGERLLSVEHAASRTVFELSDLFALRHRLQRRWERVHASLERKRRALEADVLHVQLAETLEELELTFANVKAIVGEDTASAVCQPQVAHHLARAVDTAGAQLADARSRLMDKLEATLGTNDVTSLSATTAPLHLQHRVEDTAQELEDLEELVTSRSQRLEACARYTEHAQVTRDVQAWLDDLQDTVQALEEEQRSACKDEADDEAVMSKCDAATAKIEAQATVVPWLRDASSCPDMEEARGALSRLGKLEERIAGVKERAGVAQEVHQQLAAVSSLEQHARHKAVLVREARSAASGVSAGMASFLARWRQLEAETNELQSQCNAKAAACQQLARTHPTHAAECEQQGHQLSEALALLQDEQAQTRNLGHCWDLMRQARVVQEHLDANVAGVNREMDGLEEAVVQACGDAGGDDPAPSLDRMAHVHSATADVLPLLKAALADIGEKCEALETLLQRVVLESKGADPARVSAFVSSVSRKHAVMAVDRRVKRVEGLAQRLSAIQDTLQRIDKLENWMEMQAKSVNKTSSLSASGMDSERALQSLLDEHMALERLIHQQDAAVKEMKIVWAART